MLPPPGSSLSPLPLRLTAQSLWGPESPLMMSSDTGILPFFQQLIFLLLTSLPALSTMYIENSFPQYKLLHALSLCTLCCLYLQSPMRPDSPLRTFPSFYSSQVEAQLWYSSLVLSWFQIASPSLSLPLCLGTILLYCL